MMFAITKYVQISPVAVREKDRSLITYGRVSYIDLCMGNQANQASDLRSGDRVLEKLIH